MTVRKALLAGIIQYKAVPLRGCVNDARQMQDLLVGRYGFASDDIRILVDKHASRAAIVEGLEWLAQGGDDADAVRVFFFSGHGAYVADENGDEPDGRDECLVPYDYQTAGVLTDDVLKALYDRFPRSANLTLLVDACHSGSMQKDIAEDRVYKFLPISDDEIEKIGAAARKFADDRHRFVKQTLRETDASGMEEDELEQRVAAIIEKFEKVRFGDIRNREANILLAACRDDQQATDACIAGDYHGAFTYYLVEAVDKADGQITYGDLIARLGKALYANGFVQLPQLECRGGRDGQLVFSSFA